MPTRRLHRAFTLVPFSLAMLLPSAALLTVQSPGFAQESLDAEDAEEEQTRVRALFEQGIAASKDARWDDAVSALSKALELERRPIILYSLAVAEKNSGAAAEALRHFREFLETPIDPRTDAFRGPAEQTAQELEGEIARVVIEVTPDVPNLMVRVGEVQLEPDAWKQEQILNPGQITITATAPRRGSATSTLNLEAGTRSEITLQLPDETQPASGPSALPVVLVTVGGALFVGGAIVGTIGMVEANQIDDANDDDEISAARTKALVGDVVGGVGLVAVGIGVVLFILDDDDDPEQLEEGSLRPWAQGAAQGFEVRF